MTDHSPDTTPPLLLSFAFRPLFLLVCLQAVLGITLWSAWWSGLLTLDWPVNPIYWHAHEMIAGFAGAAIGGFLLTAVATWTGRAQVSGWPLALLCLFWLGARLSLLLPLAAAASGLLWWAVLLGLMARELIQAGNRRNYKILLVLVLFFVTEAGYHLAALQGLAWQRQVVWAQMWLVLLLINLIGGRIVPAFTRNWLMQRQAGTSPDPATLPAAFGSVDLAATAALVLFALVTLLPLPGTIPLLTGVVAGILQVWRLSRWQGHRTWSDPLVWMLHIAYAWLPVGLILLACGMANLIPISAGLHALTAGTIAGMIVAVSSRAALGHTGRPLQSHPLLTGSFVLLTLAATCRVLASLTMVPVLMQVATGFWLLAFLAFGLRYWPVLTRPAHP